MVLFGWEYGEWVLKFFISLRYIVLEFFKEIYFLF